ncbi:hypothetical protein BKA58DRAFT_72564 [Alternaria rosae]|uniref:uncharacterized protein n=1 Tax=Alternaria rosae TaxID=1187941 RepID=UPI001E8E7CD5|nr:uncharacterized protein BKA58DRAFT_72564 [Alternaria rosae]KAH6848461.1 hypothetical protein BKA58DRAFT_72564 [Alternaria rosae]
MICDEHGDVEPHSHYTHDWNGPRRDARHDSPSAVALHNAEIPPSLQRASLDFINPLKQTLDADQTKLLPNLVGPALYDPFSASVRILTNNLRQLRLWAVVDESLFRLEDASQSPWSNLEILKIMLHPLRPDGSWYFHEPHGQGRNAVGYEIIVDSYPPFEISELDEDMHDLDNKSSLNSCSNEFRVVPDETRLKPFLEGSARTAARMCSLKRAIIWSPTYWDPEWDDEEAQDYDNVFYRQRPYWGIQYSDQDNGVWGSLLPYPIGPSEDKKDDPAMRCLIWMVSKWRPDTELRNLFQYLGR